MEAAPNDVLGRRSTNCTVDVMRYSLAGRGTVRGASPSHLFADAAGEKLLEDRQGAVREMVERVRAVVSRSNLVAMEFWAASKMGAKALVLEVVTASERALIE